MTNGWTNMGNNGFRHTDTVTVSDTHTNGKLFSKVWSNIDHVKEKYTSLFFIAVHKLALQIVVYNMLHYTTAKTHLEKNLLWPTFRLINVNQGCSNWRRGAKTVRFPPSQLMLLIMLNELVKTEIFVKYRVFFYW